MLAGGLPAFPRGRRRRLRMPDAMRETAADAKRARKAAKREEDARRTAEGRASAAWAEQPAPLRVGVEPQPSMPRQRSPVVEALSPAGLTNV